MEIRTHINQSWNDYFWLIFDLLWCLSPASTFDAWTLRWSRDLANNSWPHAKRRVPITPPFCQNDNTKPHLFPPMSHYHIAKFIEALLPSPWAWVFLKQQLAVADPSHNLEHPSIGHVLSVLKLLLIIQQFPQPTQHGSLTLQLHQKWLSFSKLFKKTRSSQ